MKTQTFLLVLTLFVTKVVMSDDTKSPATKECQPLVKPVKYKFQKNDHVAAVLRKFKLEPVFGRNKYLDKTLKLNQLKKADSVSTGDTLFLPFDCEADAKKWNLQNSDVGDFRWITPTLVAENPNSQDTAQEIKARLDEPPAATKPEVQAASAAMATTAAVTQMMVNESAKSNEEALAEQQSMDARLKEIISPPSKVVDPESVQGKLDEMDKQKKQGGKEEVSEALRYRMICDGEWDGDQCIPRYSVLYSSLSGWFNRYDGTDPSVSTNNKGVLLSRFNPELTLGWTHYWVKNIRSKLQASFKQTSMLPEAREVPIEQDSKLLTDFLAEVRYESGRFGYGIGFKQFDKLFYRFRFSGLTTPCIGGGAGFTGCGIFVHAASVSMLYANVNWMFYQLGKFSSDVLFTYGYLGSSNTAGWSIESGSAWSLEFRVQHDRIKEYMFGSVQYGQQAQNTSIEHQTSSELGLTLGYAWKLKDW